MASIPTYYAELEPGDVTAHGIVREVERLVTADGRESVAVTMTTGATRYFKASGVCLVRTGNDIRKTVEDLKTYRLA